jgi:cellulose synthase/poly-beta-1,6-N-acetylglucosamine synthase-like glycosyltransferase
MSTATIRLGDILVEQRAISRETLEAALHSGCMRIGETLRLRGLIDSRALADAFATQKQFPRCDLSKELPDPHLFTPRDRAHYETYRYLPFAHDAHSITLVTASPSQALLRFASTHYGRKIRFVIASERELQHCLSARAATTDTRNARLGLRRRYRHLVADRVMVRGQLRGIVLLFSALALALYASPRATWDALIVICNFFYLASLIIKLEFYRQGARAHKAQRRDEPELAARAKALPQESLPVYSILVPMYRESPEVMARLIAHLAALDYPRELLDIKLICEADDAATVKALKALKPPAMMEIIEVPASQPRTKPKACNVAMQSVRGEYVVIYDAEDAPAPDQLRRAVAMFRESDDSVACLQARLNYYNRDERLLTQLFAIEYSALFRLMLPGLERMGLPIPLGGTSNHLRVNALRAVGGWDAFNVTEDADLGIRLSYLGYRTRTLPSLTMEEAPVSLRAWLKQRTRWIKGYIQTWLVYTRDRKALKQRLGHEAYYGFQFFIGAPALTFLLAPIFWGVFLVSILGLFPGALSPTMQVLCAIAFVGGTLSQWLFARKVLEIEGWKTMQRAFYLYPLYWLLHSLAAARALVQLIVAPHYWDKTVHGVSRMLR